VQLTDAAVSAPVHDATYKTWYALGGGETCRVSSVGVFAPQSHPDDVVLLDNLEDTAHASACFPHTLISLLTMFYGLCRTFSLSLAILIIAYLSTAALAAPLSSCTCLAGPSSCSVSSCLRILVSLRVQRKGVTSPTLLFVASTLAPPQISTWLTRP